MTRLGTAIVCCALVMTAGAALAAALRRTEPALGEEDVRALAREVAEDEIEPLRRELDRTRAELRRLRSEPTAVPPAPAAPGPSKEFVEAPADVEPAAMPDDAVRRAELTVEFAALRRRVFSGGASAADLARFLEIAKSELPIDDTIQDLEGRVAAAPTDTAARMELADAYLTKLMTVPGGPEQGVWSMRAEEQWGAVLEVDPGHWQARHDRAFNWSMWPEFLGKTPAAVADFETLVDVQERDAPQARHASTYVHLARLYRRQNHEDKAREILARGAARHPGDAGIAAELRNFGE